MTSEDERWHRQAFGGTPEREADDYFGVVPTEESPLLHTDLPPDVVPDKPFQHLVLSVCVLFLFVVEVSMFVMQPPLQQVMEDRVCGEIYPDHLVGTMSETDDRCKDNTVQKELAMLRSWEVSAEMFVPFFVQIPYGIIADKYGRRPVLFLALFGAVLQTAWILLVLGVPKHFSVWSILYGNMAYFIGGGGQMAAAMVWTLLADAIPMAERTSVFYLLHAMILILGVLVNPIAALLLKTNPWIALWLGFAILVVGVFASLLVPETLALRQKADSKRCRGGIVDGAIHANYSPRKSRVQHVVFTMKNDMGHVWRFIFASKSVMILIVAYTINFPIKLNQTFNLLQYMTKRFDLAWSTATYISTVSNVTAAVVLLVVLPAGSWVLANKCKEGPLKRDLILTRMSVVFIMAGSFLIAMAPTVWLFIAALVLTSLGTGFSTLCRALLNAVVEPHTVATLKTTVSMMETVMGLVSSPILGWLLSKGIELGGIWMGLPYLVCAVLAALTGVMMLAYRFPTGFAQASS
ncbi:MFS transporter [Metarhizium album ARSEF 1941]|uniref:MFS transporter n=1 Tax=Metarhizium album (strain ARSEF 1941) TaxID=1081103 RepID=A0A0B2X4L8_METAS|nr:MFS transporter [Metarhizium album ARSEF 1941]KHO01274.1 MFS transporter [Metarhizium album ARSEF 1941]